MLTNIHIKNYILVENLSIEFSNGLNILTGETGAGKSLWMDATLIALGARTDASIIRNKTDFCSITLTFDISHNAAALTWLADHDIEAESTCIIRRCIYKDRGSKTTINDQPCTQQSVKQFAELLLSIHGQHHHQFLLKTEKQRDYLDAFAGSEKLLTQIADLYQQYKSNQKQIEQLKQQNKHQKDQSDLYKFHLQEIEALQLKANEWQEINQKHQAMHHKKDLLQHANAIVQTLQEDNQAVLPLLNHCEKDLLAISQIDDKVNNSLQILQEAQINLTEVVSDMQHYLDALDVSTDANEDIEARLSTMHAIARKHHIEPDAILAFAEQLTEKIHLIDHADQIIIDLENKQKQLIEQYQTIATKLTKQRQKFAKTLSKSVTEDLQLLGMEGGQFTIQLAPNNQVINKYGLEDIQFLVTANVGQPLSTLQNSVSGGELSRLSLSIHRHLAKQNQHPTLIFDEVDTGIGGKTADKVGALLKELSQDYQILCITHLPQIASLANQHFKAEKISNKTSTKTVMTVLDQPQRIEELARMLGGDHLTDAIRKHAEQLIT